MEAGDLRATRNDGLRVSELTGLGLTENQAKAYLALLELARAPASTLSKISGVPRNKVYGVVEELNQKGLADIILDDPIQFEARPIAHFLDHLVAELEDRRGRIADDKARLSAVFRTHEPDPTSDAPGGSFRIFRGRRAVIQQYGRMNRSTARSMRVLASRFSAARTFATGNLDAYPERDAVQFEVLTPMGIDNVSQVEAAHRILGDRLRVVDDLPEHLVIKMADDREVLFVHFVPDSDSVTSGDDIAVWTDSPIFLLIARAMLNAAAARSVSFETARARLGAGVVAPRIEVLNEPAKMARIGYELLRSTKTVDSIVPYAHLDLGIRTVSRDVERVTGHLTRVRIVTDAPPQALAGVSWSPVTEIRHVPALQLRLTIYDQHVLRFWPVDPREDPTVGKSGVTGVLTNLDAAMREARDHFERVWATAAPTSVRPKPPAMPGLATTVTVGRP